MRKTLTALMLFVFLSGIFLSACSQPAAPSEMVTLKIAVLPILDALPLHVAQQEGFFEARGVKVELITIGSAPERDQLIAAGQADGMINEAVSTIFYNQDQVQVQTVRFARAATAQTPLFSLLASGNSDIQSVEDLKGVEVGVSQGTVIEYLNDRLLQAEGLSNSEIKVVAVPRLDLRLTLLGSGELKAGILPEPLASLAVLQGARVIIDDTRHPELSFSTLTFRKQVIDQHPEAMRAFLAAVEDATGKINANPNQYKALLGELKMVPAPLMDTFQVPQFVTAGVPTEAQWNDAVAWVKEEGLLSQEKNVPYSTSVRSDLLP